MTLFLVFVRWWNKKNKKIKTCSELDVTKVGDGLHYASNLDWSITLDTKSFSFFSWWIVLKADQGGGKKITIGSPSLIWMRPVLVDGLGQSVCDRMQLIRSFQKRYWRHQPNTVITSVYHTVSACIGLASLQPLQSEHVGVASPLQTSFCSGMHCACKLCVACWG